MSSTSVPLPELFTDLGQRELCWEHGGRSVSINNIDGNCMEVMQMSPHYIGYVPNPGQQDVVRALEWMMGGQLSPYLGTYWGGKPAYCEQVHVVVAEPSHPNFWFAKYAGQIRSAVRVQTGTGTLYIDDDSHGEERVPGEGWFYVTWGRGLPQNPSHMLEIDREATEQDLQVFNSYNKPYERELQNLIRDWRHASRMKSVSQEQSEVYLECMHDLRSILLKVP